jgi:two-component system OmpR family response regulator
MRVLLVDDPVLATSLCRDLRSSGIAADAVDSGDEAVAAAGTVAYDVIVLDIALAGRDGAEVARELRARRISSSILMLASHADVDNRVLCLDAGADDFLVRPVALRELVARLRALARRHLPDRAVVLTAGAIVLDMGARRLLASGTEVALTPTEFSVLELFMLHRGQVLTRRQVLDNVWGWRLENGRNLVQVYVWRLRRKLAAAGAGNPFTTIRGAGYRLDAPS